MKWIYTLFDGYVMYYMINCEIIKELCFVLLFNKNQFCECEYDRIIQSFLNKQKKEERNQRQQNINNKILCLNLYSILPPHSLHS